ncbi:sigma-70 family RNA polymerase sigma factor [Kribbella sp. NPDC049174]|uniref:sigma-70 family RNA polymerase sigma factor n=1 Tax=Kribbella sp. NPDC049174 TaxID=3364112 RepID=UPI003722FB86
MGNRADAEDLTQEVFIRVFRHLEDYAEGTFEGWLYRITKNLFLDQLRRRRAARLEPLADTHLRFVHPGPERDLEWRTFDPDIRDALTSLPPGHLATVLLHDIDGLTYDEIAVVLGVPHGTVASRLHPCTQATANRARPPHTRTAVCCLTMHGSRVFQPPSPTEAELSAEPCTVPFDGTATNKQRASRPGGRGRVACDRSRRRGSRCVRPPLAVELRDAEGGEETLETGVQFALQALNCDYADGSAAGQIMIGRGWSKQGLQSPRDARDPWCGSWCEMTDTTGEILGWCGRTC